MANAVYNVFKTAILSGDIAFVADDIYLMLVSGDYAPNIDSHRTTGDVTTEVVGSVGYVHGGKAIASKSVSQDNTDDEGVFTGANLQWAASSIRARGAVLYHRPTSILIAYYDFGANITSTAAAFDVTVPAEGLINVN